MGSSSMEDQIQLSGIALDGANWWEFPHRRLIINLDGAAKEKKDS